MKKENPFSLRTVRKKLLLLTKLAGVFLFFSYIFFGGLPIREEVSTFLWMLRMVFLTLAVDFFMGLFISRPVEKLNRSARKMAELDFSHPCEIHTGDEFGELSGSLNAMAENLKETLLKLEREMERERCLLEERKELVDSLSHEMKTPLGVIRAYAEGLQDAADEAQRQRYIQVILSETGRMHELIYTLLDLSALETGAAALRPEPFGFVELVETVAGRLLVDDPEGDFVLEYELPEEEFFVRADKRRMEQALDNLILNAKKNVVPGGVLKLSLILQGDSLRFSVYDQGTQIPRENMDKIWTKFYRDRDCAYSGSGLGLAIVAQILSMQDMPYGVENRPGGVEFYFSVPVFR